MQNLRRTLSVIVVVACSVLSRPGRTEPVRKPVSVAGIHPLSGIGYNAIASFTGWNAPLQLAAVGITPLLITSGADTRWHNACARHQTLHPYSVPGVYLGYLLPIGLSGSLYGVGVLGGSSRELLAAHAVVQATLLAVTYQSVLKAVTGRPPPEPETYRDDSRSRSFRFGFLRGGIHYGWPSGHMMTTTALATTMVNLYPDEWWVPVASGLGWAAMFGSVAIHEKSSMHWLSDMVAGSLMGAAIGNGVGQGFRRLATKDTSEAAFVVSPMPLPDGGWGLSVNATL